MDRRRALAVPRYLAAVTLAFLPTFDTSAAVPESRVLGLPLEGDWVVLVIDTSGSMLGEHWKDVQDLTGAILDAHPPMRGLQILNDEGKSLWPRNGGQWLTDSPDQRRLLIQRMSRWRAFSDSDPVQGIVKALTLGAHVQGKLDIYVLADEFTGSSVEAALQQVALASSRGASDARKVRIHGIVFPPGPKFPPYTHYRLIELMKSLCRDNDGMLVTYTATDMSVQ